MPLDASDILLCINLHNSIDAKDCAPYTPLQIPVILCLSFTQSTTQHNLAHFLTFIFNLLSPFVYLQRKRTCFDLCFVYTVQQRCVGKVTWSVCKPHTHKLVLFVNDCTFVRNILVQLINLQGFLITSCMFFHFVKSFTSVLSVMQI